MPSTKKRLKTIMIIDDDADDILMFCEALGELDKNIHCITSSNCAEAMQVLETETSNAPRCIFLDLNMPRMNGKQCLLELKKHKNLRNIPVIIYTTSKRPEDISEVKDLGAVEFITKPARYSDLKKILQKVLVEKWKSSKALI